MAQIDHLVVLCRSLPEGRAFIQAKLGVELQAGGKHVHQGTHNLLLRLGESCYLEVLAIDPEASPEDPWRWFGFADNSVQALLEKHGAFLATWVARVDDLATAVAEYAESLRIRTLQRGHYHWSIAYPEQGQLRSGGRLPYLIQWHGSRHPADDLPPSRCSAPQLFFMHSAQPDCPEVAAVHRGSSNHGESLAKIEVSGETREITFLYTE